MLSNVLLRTKRVMVKNLKGKGPLLLIHQHSVGNKSAASKLEYQVKKLSRAKKEAYVASFKTG